MSWPVFGACLGAILAFAVCRFFLARAGVIQRFLVSWPTDPDRMPQPPGGVYWGVFAAWLFAFVLIACSLSAVGAVLLAAFLFFQIGLRFPTVYVCVGSVFRFQSSAI